MVLSRLGKALAVLQLAGVAAAAAAIDPIHAKGQYFFYKNGTQFFIRGVAYQQGVNVNGQGDAISKDVNDPLADSAACQRDIPYLQKLGTNAIRVYAIDPTKDHSTCMNALADAGIYVIADLSRPDRSVERDTPSWDTALYSQYTAVIDALSKYPNTLGFFAGNEVTNNKTNTQASAFVKAAVRDSKAYIKSKNLGRWLGVGYATNDDSETRDNLANYFNCGSPDDSVDFWGYNIYEWCGQSTFQTSGYEDRTKFFQNYSVPAFFSEYGCQNPGGADARVFQETEALYSDNMNKVWSGGFVYEFFEEQNDYGLVRVSGNQVTPMKNFDALAKVIAKSGYPAPIDEKSYNPTNSPRACPPVGGNWQASDTLPPVPNSTVCGCMFNGLSCRASSKISSNATAVGAMFGQVCGLDQKACSGISANATTGKYGVYSGCNSTEKLGNVLNQYYQDQQSSASACDFGGNAALVSNAQPASTCSAVLAAASSSAAAGGSASGKNAAGSLLTTTGGWGIGGAVGVVSILVSFVAGAASIML